MASRRRSALAIGLCLFVWSGGHLFGQQVTNATGDKVVLTELSAPSGDNIAQTVASTITSSLDLLLRLSGTVKVSRADFLSPEYSFKKALLYYHLFKARAGISGEIKPARNGGYTIAVDIWTTKDKTGKPTVYKRSISNILGVFDVADQLSVQVASKAVGQTLTLGDLRVQIAGNLPHFSVYADGHLLGRDKRSFRILTGKREIVVAKPGLVGDETVKVFKVIISKSKPTIVKVDVKAPKLAGQSGPKKPGAKPAPALPKPKVGRLVAEITPTEANAQTLNLVIDGAGVHKVLVSTNPKSPFVTELAPGSYKLSASLGQDPSPVTSTVRIELNKQTRIAESVSYSRRYRISALSSQRRSAVNELDARNAIRQKRFKTATILSLLGLGGGGVAGYYAWQLSNNLSAYQSATDPATATQLHTTITDNRIIFGGAAAVGGIFIAAAAVNLFRMPGRGDLQKQIAELDRSLRTLNANSQKENRTTEARVLSVTPIMTGGVGINSIIRTVAGTGNNGFLSGGGSGKVATSADIMQPTDVGVDSGGDLYIVESANNTVDKVNAKTHIIVTFAGVGIAGSGGDGGPAAAAHLDHPTGVAVDAKGNVYIADSGDNRIRRVDARSGIISTYAGNGTAGLSGDGGPAASAELDNPTGLALDSAGNLYIADHDNNRIRRVDAKTGIITTVAGGGEKGNIGDGGPATSAFLAGPYDLAMDAAGNLFIADREGNRIREVDARSGTIKTIAGTGTAGYSGDGLPAIRAEINSPTGIVLDGAGNLYFSDSYNNRIREITKGGIITTVTGDGKQGFSGDNSTAGFAEVYSPTGLAFDSGGNLFFADSANNRVREMERIQ